MKRRSMPAAAAFAAATALLLTACGSGGDSSKADAEIKGAGSEASGSASASASPSGSAAVDAVDRPTMSFPSDFSMVFDRTTPSDPDKAAALTDAENFLRAVNYGIVQQDAEAAAYKFYTEPLSAAQKYAKSQIQQNIDDGYTVTGVQRYSRATVDMADAGDRAVVSFCDDDSKFYSKEIKSKKVHISEPSSRDYNLFEIVMIAPKDAQRPWTADRVQVQEEATQCKA